MPRPGKFVANTRQNRVPWVREIEPILEKKPLDELKKICGQLGLKKNGDERVLAERVIQLAETCFNKGDRRAFGHLKEIVGASARGPAPTVTGQLPTEEIEEEENQVTSHHSHTAPITIFDTSHLPLYAPRQMPRPRLPGWRERLSSIPGNPGPWAFETEEMKGMDKNDK